MPASVKMLRNLALLTLGLCMAGRGTLRADEALRRVQQSLRDQGFYYGPIDGSPGDETTQAVRRYQIRNGLPVTGQLDDETRRTIEKTGGPVAPGAGESITGNSRGTTARPTSTPARSESSPSYQRPTVRPVPEETPNRSTDRIPRDIEDEDSNDAPGSVPAPATRPDYPDARPDLRAGPGAPPPRVYEPEARIPRGAIVPSSRLNSLFEGTPYEFAPPPVQGDVLRRVQALLTRQGFYDGSINGIPGGSTADAIYEFQGVNRLRRTGRLDVATLGTLHLLPGRQRVLRPGHDDGDDSRNGPNFIFEGRVVR